MLQRCLKNSVANVARTRRRIRRTSSHGGAVLLALIVSGCKAPANYPSDHLASTLTMGVGQVTSNPQFGMRQAAALLSLEGLAVVGADGKSRPLLAAEWTFSPDGRDLTIRLRPSVRFHDGTPVNADTIKMVLDRELPKALGPSGQEVTEIARASDLVLDLRLKERSNFVVEALDFP